jgi:hypothetical protein
MTGRRHLARGIFIGNVRCYDGSHSTADGKLTISHDCGVCHQLQAVGQPSPDILKTLGLWNYVETLKGVSTAAENGAK